MAADVCLMGGTQGRVAVQVKAGILLVLAAQARPATERPVAVAEPAAAAAAAAAAVAAAEPDVFPSAPAFCE